MLLETKELTKEYTRGEHAFYAVDHIDFSIHEGDFVSIIGRSGSGKSTFLNLLSGLLLPTSGSLLYNGDDISMYSDKELSLFRNTRIGYVPQGQSTLSNLSVLDNVRLPYYLFKREGDNTQRAQQLLEELGISHLTDSFPKALSGGELRRVSIARALINEPPLLIADEPTSDLDAQTTAGIMQLFQDIAAQGTAVLLVTHELDTLSYSQSTYVMSDGRLSPRES
ncbi:MAG: ABC transporter ATP-binding protein [Lachnospiraceae bacterium]